MTHTKEKEHNTKDICVFEIHTYMYDKLYISEHIYTSLNVRSVILK
jgi:hypothetical protein